MPGKPGDQALGCGCLVILALIGWGVGVFYSTHKEADLEDDQKATEARAMIQSQFALRLPESTDIRLHQKGGFNLDVFIERRAFESVPYPDRAGFIETAGKAWCDHVEQAMLPSLTVRDIRTGQNLASYNCVLSHVSIE
jgi:ethanolamine ammonia-lyase large subunit